MVVCISWTDSKRARDLHDACRDTCKGKWKLSCSTVNKSFTEFMSEKYLCGFHFPRYGDKLIDAKVFWRILVTCWYRDVSIRATLTVQYIWWHKQVKLSVNKQPLTWAMWSFLLCKRPAKKHRQIKLLVKAYMCVKRLVISVCFNFIIKNLTCCKCS